ncbi:MAG: sel1 repeat family protein [Gammaproteobacteria bacterium]|nr:sel1 repeat family protein [Gammaproteobacteria bacterium]
MNVWLRAPVTAVGVVSGHLVLMRGLWPWVKRGVEAAGLHSTLADAQLGAFGALYCAMLFLAWRFLAHDWLPLPRRAPAAPAADRDPASAVHADWSPDPVALHHEGLALLEGQGGMLDYAAARQRFATAAALGYVPSRMSLALVQLEGQGGARDVSAGLAGLEALCAEGEPHAQYLLGNLYRLGQHVAMDLARAATLYAEAAARGMPMAQTNLGLMYLQGMGVAVDRVEACKWLSMAADRGDALAARHVAELRGELSAAEISEAEARVGEESLRRVRAFVAEGAQAPMHRRSAVMPPARTPEGAPVRRFHLGLAELTLPADYQRDDTRGTPFIFQAQGQPTLAVRLMSPSTPLDGELRERMVEVELRLMLEKAAVDAGCEPAPAITREALDDVGDVLLCGLESAGAAPLQSILLFMLVAPDGRIANMSLQGESSLAALYAQARAVAQGWRWRA